MTNSPLPDIDDKLREILQKAQYGSEMVDPMPIEQIKQAFADEGYSTFRDRDGPKWMSGGIWYDRFEKELSNEIYGDTNPTDKVDCEGVPYVCTCDLLEAAKRAAGKDEADK